MRPLGKGISPLNINKILNKKSKKITMKMNKFYYEL